ncbi:MAG: hypothetical protein FVQ77_10870, partial [Cytophagales bacterium]|nr:hypothetical protein [Cytophagales bacterium]
GNFTGILDNSDLFGRDVDNIGDLDGDGITDMVVGAVLDDDGGFDRGAVWILFLNSNGTVKLSQKISDTQGNFTGILDDSDLFGRSVASLGDLDGDGIRDIVVNAARDDDGGTDRGAIWILFLNSNGTVKSQQKISGTQGNFSGILDNSDYFGYEVTSLGDLNGDGINDIAVGTTGDDDGGTDRGAVWILYLNTNGTVKSYLKISSTQGNFSGVLDNSDHFGISAASLGDLNGDGRTDIAIGARLDDDGGTDRGAVWILFLEDTCAPPTPCNISASFTVNDTLICDSTTLFFINTSINTTEYEWQLNAVFYDTSANVSITFDTAGVYTVTLIAQDSLCPDTFSKTITVLPNLIANAWADTTICLYDSVQLYASPGTSHVWIPSKGLNDTLIPNPIAKPDTTTTYNVIISSTGCEADTAFVTVSVNPLPIVYAYPDTTINPGASVQLNGGGGVSYLWSPGAGLSDSTKQNPVATPPQTTTWWVTVTDSNGCQNMASVTIIVTGCIPPIADFSFTDTNLTVIFFDSSLNAESLFWNFGNSLFDILQNPTHIYATTGTYKVCLSVFNSCGFDSTCKAVTITVEKLLFIPSAFSPNGDKVNDQFKVIGKGIKSIYLAVYNRWGEKVYEANDVYEALFVGWNGKHRRKEQGMAVFVYYAKVEFVDGTNDTRKGDVTLIR